jgi:PAS domain S-box-containing protein
MVQLNKKSEDKNWQNKEKDKLFWHNSDTPAMENKRHKQILETAPVGYALHRIITDDIGNPCDYIFEETNETFGKITGLNHLDIIGKRVTEVIPDIRNSEFEWIPFFGNVALNGISQEFEEYFKPLDKWFKGQVSSDQKNYFTAIFIDVTGQHLLVDAIKKLQDYSVKTIDYQEITEALRNISGAQYAVFNLFEKNGRDFTTIALSGLGSNFEKATRFLGFNILGKKWKYDPVRESKIKDKKSTHFRRISELTGKAIPPVIIDVISKTFGIKEAVVVKITRNEIMVGDFTLLYSQEVNQERILQTESYADTIGMLLYRIRAEEELTQQKEEIENFFNVNLDLLCIANDEGRFIKVNKEWENLLGYSNEELMEKKFLEFVHPEDLPATRKAIEKLSTGKEKVYEFVNRYYCKNGSYRYIEWRYHPYNNLIYAAARDITEKRKNEEALKERDALLKKLSKQVPGVIFQFQYYPDGRRSFPYMSDNAWEIFELSVDEIVSDASKPFSRIICEDHDGVIESMRISSQTLTRWDHDFRVLLPQKGVRWLSGIANPEYVADGSVLWHGYINDISMRKDEENLLQTIKEQYELAIEGSNDGIWDWDLRSNTVFLSKRWKEMLGYEDHELVNDFSTFTSLLYDEDKPRVEQYIKDYLDGKIKQYEIDIRLKHKNGSLRWITSRGSAVKDENGIPYRMAGSHSDITERFRSDEKIRMFSLAVEQSPASIVITDISGTIEYVNPRFCKITGYSYEEAIGKNPRILKSGVFSKEHYEELWNTIASGNEWRGEMHNRKRNGELYWEFASISPIKNPSGKITHYLAVKEDITERKIAEQKLLESESFQRVLLENIAVGVLIVDPQTRLVENINNFGANLIGTDKKNIIGKKCHQFVCPSMENQCPICDLHMEVDNSDKILIRADGEQLPILKTVKKVVIKGKEVLLESFVDISMQKKAQQALRENEQLLHSVLQSQKEMICRFKQDTTLTYVNKSYCTLYNKKSEELLGTKWIELVPITDHERILNHLKTFEAGSEDSIAYEYKVALPDGQIKWQHWTDHMIKDEKGDFIEFQSVGFDITDRKEKERLEKDIEIARNSLKFKQNFLASMSHEMRTPLTGIMGITHLLEDTPLNDNQKDFLSMLRQTSESLSLIIDQVLDYSRIESGRVQLNIDKHPTDELLKQATKFFESICNKPIRFVTHIDPVIPSTIAFDQQRINQVINNLLINSVKYSESGQICLHIGKAESSNNDPSCIMIRVELSDSGIGISPERQQSIFSPFSQVHEIETENYKGIGLGLAICKEIVEIHGGNIEIKSSNTHGTTICFTFEANLPEESEVPLNKNFVTPTKLRILFVEDKQTTQKVVKLMLNALGHTVSLANNGQDAITNFSPTDFDLILMDIQMPILDGISTAKAIRKKYGNPPPIIGLSANVFEGDREKYMALGLDEFLTKPLKLESFRDVLPKFFP